MDRVTDPQNIRLLLQVVALALPAIALWMSYSVNHLKRIESQYLSGEKYPTPVGDLERTRLDINRQQWSSAYFRFGLVFLNISGMIFLLHILLSIIVSINLLDVVLVFAGILFLILFFMSTSIAIVYSGGGVVIKAVKYYFGSENQSEEHSIVSPPCRQPSSRSRPLRTKSGNSNSSAPLSSNIKYNVDNDLSRSGEGRPTGSCECEKDFRNPEGGT